MISVGLIGYGKMGQIRANALGINNKVYIHSVYDIMSTYKQRQLEGPSSPDIINNKEIDAVFICTPNYLNQSLTLKALNAGKYVFCETSCL